MADGPVTKFLHGESAVQDWYRRKQLEKYGSYFGGGTQPSRQRSPDSGSQVGAQGNVEPQREPETLKQDNQRYWAANRIENGAREQFTQSLNNMNRSEIPSSGGGQAMQALGMQSNTENPTTGTNKTPGDFLSLYVGSNEGKLPNLSFGKGAPPEFYADPPKWVTDNEQYTATLNRLGTVKRRRNSELDDYSRGDAAIQEVLNAAGYDTGGVDGYWGDKTDAALRQFKADNGLGDNTELDHTTREALKKTVIEISNWANNSIYE